MKTVGEILSEARKAKNLKLEEVVQKTKIRVCFLRAIEKNDFASIPSYICAKGFIKNYSQFLKVSSNFALAIFRREYEPDKEGRIIPRGLVSPLDRPSFWTRKRIGISVLAFLFSLLIVFYLRQYWSLLAGPNLRVDVPLEREKVRSYLVEVKGKTDPDATVTINGDLVMVSQNGEFATIVELTEGENTLLAEATNRLGKKRLVARKVEVVSN